MFMVQTAFDMFSGFTSYVGKQVYVKRAKLFLDLEYYECEILNGSQQRFPREQPKRSCFSPWMIHYLARINESQYDKLLLELCLVDPLDMVHLPQIKDLTPRPVSSARVVKEVHTVFSVTPD